MVPSPEPYPQLHDLTTVAFALHIAGGTFGLVSGLIALFTRKGGRVHRTAGAVFVISMLIMAVFAGYLAVVRPGQMVNLIIATFAIYLVTTGWLAVHRRESTSGLAEKITLLIALGLCAPFAFFSYQTATGADPRFTGPVMVAIYGFTTIIALAALTDIRLILKGGIAGAPRIARHLWRMCLGLTMAIGSFSTNAVPRLFPGPVHVTFLNFVPQLVMLSLLVFWLARVRLTGWFKRWRTAPPTPVESPL